MSFSIERMNQQLNDLSSHMVTSLLGTNALTAKFSSKQTKMASLIKCTMVALAVIAFFSVLFNPLFFLVGLVAGGCHKFSALELTAVGERLKEMAKVYPKVTLALTAFSSIFAGGFFVGALMGQGLRHRFTLN